MGQWNVNTVTMGGLGKDPDLTAEVEQAGESDDVFLPCQVHVIL